MFIALFERNPGTAAPEAASGERAARGIGTAMALGRIAIGLGLAVAPAPALRALGFRRSSPATTVVARIAGGRDIVLGAVTLLSRDDPERLAAASLANAAVDAGDALTFAAALRGEEELHPAALRGVAAAVPAALTGLWVGLSLLAESRRGRVDRPSAPDAPG